MPELGRFLLILWLVGGTAHGVACALSGQRDSALVNGARFVAGFLLFPFTVTIMFMGLVLWLVGLPFTRRG